MVPGARPPSFDPTTVLIAFEYPASGGQPPSYRGSQRGPALNCPSFVPHLADTMLAILFSELFMMGIHVLQQLFYIYGFYYVLFQFVVRIILLFIAVMTLRISPRTRESPPNLLPANIL